MIQGGFMIQRADGNCSFKCISEGFINMFEYTLEELSEWHFYVGWRKMVKRYQMYYKKLVGKMEMYLLCQKYHMSGSVQYVQNNEMLFELFGEENEIIYFMSVLERYMKRQPSKVIEVESEPDYGRGDFRIG